MTRPHQKSISPFAEASPFAVPIPLWNRHSERKGFDGMTQVQWPRPIKMIREFYRFDRSRFGRKWFLGGVCSLVLMFKTKLLVEQSDMNRHDLLWYLMIGIFTGWLSSLLDQGRGMGIVRDMAL